MTLADEIRKLIADAYALLLPEQDTTLWFAVPDDLILAAHKATESGLLERWRDRERSDHLHRITDQGIEWIGHENFHSLEAFDTHDEHDETRWPVWLDLLDRDGKDRLVALTHAGECRLHAETQTGVTVGTTAGYQRAAAVFQGSAQAA